MWPHGLLIIFEKECSGSCWTSAVDPTCAVILATATSAAVTSKLGAAHRDVAPTTGRDKHSLMGKKCMFVFAHLYLIDPILGYFRKQKSCESMPVFRNPSIKLPFVSREKERFLFVL